MKRPHNANSHNPRVHRDLPFGAAVAWLIKSAGAGFCGLCFLLVASTASAGVAYDVFLLAGQSNMDGMGLTNDLVGGFSVWTQPQTNVLIYYDNHFLTNYVPSWQSLKPGWSGESATGFTLSPTNFGPELTIGYVLANAFPGHHIALIKVSKGGTSLAEDWSPGQDMYDDFTNAVPTALQQLQTLNGGGNTYTVRGMLWHQGEADYGETHDYYENLLTNFITSVRSTLGLPNLPFVIGEINQVNPVPGYLIIRQAQYDSSQIAPNAYFVTSMNLPVQSDGLHFLSTAVLGLGERFGSQGCAFMSTSAATQTWALAGSGTWSTNAVAWTTNGGTTTSAWNNGGNAAVFGPAGSNPTVTLSGAINAYSLTIASNATGYTFSGGTLTIGNGGIVANQSAAIGSFLITGGIQIQSVVTNQTLTVAGPLNLSIHTVSITGNGLTTLSGLVSDVGNDPTNSLFLYNSALIQKLGNGTLTVLNSNIFTGGILIRSGTVQIGDGISNNGVVLSNIEDYAALVFANPFSETYSGTLIGTGMVTKTGAGTLLLTGSNTYSGGTIINGGTVSISADSNLGGGGYYYSGDGFLMLENGGMLQITGTNDIDFGRPIVLGVGGGGFDVNSPSNALMLSSPVSGAGGFTKSGAGTLTMANTLTYTGPTRIAQGTLNLAGIQIAGPVNVAAGSSLNMGPVNGLMGQYYNIQPSNVNTSDPDFATLTALSNALSGQTPSLWSVSTAAGPNFDFGQAGSGFPNPYNANAYNLEAVWTGTFNAPTNGTYTFDTASDDGSMIWIDGNLVVSNNFFQGLTTRSGTTNLATGAHAITIGYFQGDNTYELYADVTVPGNGMQRLPNSLLQFGATAFTIGSLSGDPGSAVNLASYQLTVNQTSNGTFAGSISGPGGSLIKSGPATLTLTGSSTFGNATTVSNGTLLVDNTGGSGTGLGAVTIDGGATLGGTGTIGGAVSVGASGVFAPGGPAGTLTVNNNLGLNNASMLDCALGTTGAETVVNGNLTLGGTLNVTDSGGFNTGAYVLFTYSGTLVNNGLTVGSTPNGSWTYRVDTRINGLVRLEVTTGVTALPLLPYEQTVTNSLPYAFWRLNETNGIVAFDYFASYNGTINPGVTLGVNGPEDPPFVGFGTNNTAMLLTGATNSFLTMPQFNLNTNAITITGWINPSGMEPASAGVVFCRSATTAAGINFGPGSNNELRYTWNGVRSNISTGLIVPTNQWSYFALVVSPTNATLYVGTNGILNSFMDSVTETNQAFDAPLLIGSDAGVTNRLFIGSIADIALYEGALTSSQIQIQYSTAAGCIGTPVIISSPTNQTVVAGSNATFTVQATGLPALLYQWQSSVNGGTTWSFLSGATDTSYTTSTLATNNSGSLFRAIVSETCGSPVTSSVAMVTVTPGPLLPSKYAQTVVNDGPFAYWRLNETNGATVAYDFYDVYNGTIGAAVTAGVPGPQGPTFQGFETTNTAMRLTGGAGSALTMPTLNLNTNTVTVTGWINPSSYQSGWAGVVFCRGGTTVSGVNFGPGSPANELRYTWNNDRFDVSTGLIVPTNQWSFFALVVTPTEATVYLGTNGVLNSFTDSAALSSSAFDAPLMLGEDPSSGGRYYAGALDEVAVFRQSMSAAQIQMLYSNALVALSPSTVGFTGSPTSGTAPLAVTFTDGSTGSITNWYWNFGDGSTTNFSIQTNPVHTYVAGTYNVSLTVSGPGGTNSLTRSSYIVSTNPAPPVAAFIGSPATGAAPLMVRFTDNSTGSISNWYWNFGDGNTTNFATLTNPTHTYAVGTYSVSLTVSGLGGTNRSTQSNYIQALNPAQLLVNPSSLNYGSVTIGLTNLLNFSVINTGGAALSGTAASAAPFVVSSGGSYNVAGAQTASVTVAFAPGGTGTFNGSVVFTSNGGDSTNAISGVGLTPGSIAVTPTTMDFGAVATGTTAQASFVVTNSGGTAVSNGTTAVSGGPFTILFGAAFSVPGLGTTNVMVQFAPVSAGGFTDTVVFATANGGNTSNTVTGMGAVAPVASFTANPIAGTEPVGVIFSDTSTGTQPITLVWNLGDSVLVTNAGGTGFSHTYAAGIYTVALTASNAFGTSTLVSNSMITVVTALQAWQQDYFGCTNCAQAQPNADPLGKGMSNTNQFLVGFNPTNSAAYLHVISIARTNATDINVIYLGPNGDSTWSPGIASRTNVLEFTEGTASGGYSNNFVTANVTNILSGGTGSGVVTNMVDIGGVTNGTSRYYRVRVLLP